MTEMGQCCSSDTPPTTSTRKKTNVSVNEGRDRLTVLTYDVGEAKKQDCSIEWQEAGQDHYNLVMRAVDRTTNTEYTNTLPQSIPGDVKRQMGTPRFSKEGKKAMFDLNRPKDVSLQLYARKTGIKQSSSDLGQ